MGGAVEASAASQVLLDGQVSPMPGPRSFATLPEAGTVAPNIRMMQSAFIRVLR